MKKVLEDLLGKVGSEGIPACLDSSLTPSWDAYVAEVAPKYHTPKDRVLHVLGFLHLLVMSGIKTSISPYKALEALLEEAATDAVSALVVHARKWRIFDYLRVYKSSVGVSPDSRREARLSFCFEPRKRESLDAVLAKLSGTLYSGELPKPLAPASSARQLPSYSSVFKAVPATGLPLVVDPTYSVVVVRAKGELLVLSQRLNLGERPAWLSQLEYQRAVCKALKKAFLKFGAYK